MHISIIVEGIYLSIDIINIYHIYRYIYIFFEKNLKLSYV
jgi:hypothetical protein